MMTETNNSTKHCKCGCGTIVRENYAIGHHRRGAKMPEGFKQNMSKRMSGKNNPFYGKKHTEETRKHLSETHKAPRPYRLGIKHSEETKKKMSISHSGKNHPNFGKHLSEETRKKISIKHIGKKCPRPSLGWIRSKDGYKMFMVNGKEVLEHNLVWIKHNECPIPKGWIIHHINQNKLDNRIENLVCIQRGYHMTLHKKLRELERQKQVI